MRLIQVENNVVVNVSIDENRDAAPDGWQQDDTAQVGWSLQGSEFVAPQPPSATADDVRNERNARLVQSDWTQVADAPVDQAAWAVYRQELRDVTEQAGFPAAVEWPIKPEVT